jgi:hypothetical protein
MGAMNWERWARAGGIGFVLFAIAAFVVGGEPPMVSDSAEEVVSYYDGERWQVLASSFLFVVGLILLLWFAGAIANALREKGEGRVGATLIAAVTAFVSLQIVLTGISAALAHSVAAEADPDVVRALNSLSWVLDMLAALPGAVFALTAAIGLRRAQMIPSWLSWAGVALAVLFILRSTTWARDGFWSPTGGYLFILIPLALLWILITSIVLVRAASPASSMAQPTPSTPGME